MANRLMWCVAGQIKGQSEPKRSVISTLNFVIAHYLVQLIIIEKHVYQLIAYNITLFYTETTT